MKKPFTVTRYDSYSVPWQYVSPAQKDPLGWVGSHRLSYSLMIASLHPMIDHVWQSHDFSCAFV